MPSLTRDQREAPMPAYIISDVSVQDAEAFQRYRTRAAD